MPRPAATKRATHSFPGMRILGAGLLGLLVSGWFIAGSIAGYHEFAARSFLDAWSYQNSLLNVIGRSFSPTPTQTASARQHADLAVRLAPWNADNQLTAGNVYLWESASAAPAPQWREKSLMLLRNACRISPSRPDLWARLARGKLMVGEVDAEFATALQNASRLGAWRPSTMYDIVEIGLRAWPKLDQATRESVLGIIANSQTWNAAPNVSIRHALVIQELTERLGRKADVCQQLTGPARASQRFCPADSNSKPGQT
ncbi:MAG TPA: hypothetical protein VFW49_11815 [Fluviicoccus sp.]|nr:hypothetical protein [Fluviicoccus sp.]